MTEKKKKRFNEGDKRGVCESGVNDKGTNQKQTMIKD